MTRHEISSTRIRVLLLLLVVGPLVAAILLVRFLSEFADAQRNEALEQMQAIYQTGLVMAGTGFTRQQEHLRNEPRAVAESALAHFTSIFGPSIVVQVVDPDARVTLRSSGDGAFPIARTRLMASGRTLDVQLAVERNSPELSAVSAGTQHYVWFSVLAVGVNLVIAAFAARIVSRQLKMHELRGTTLSIVAHELRTPLASMRLLLETLVAGRVRDAQQQREYLELAFRENERLSRLVERFLTFSRIDARPVVLRKERVPLDGVVRGAIEAAGLEGSGLPELRLDPTVSELEADQEAITLVLANLLENAVKYSGEEKKVSLATRRLAQGIEIAVEDNGIGIPESEFGNIFREFHQVDQRLARTAEGCGLGLSIVKALVEAHGGKVLVESIVGKGSIFRVRLPAPATA